MNCKILKCVSHFLIVTLCAAAAACASHSTGGAFSPPYHEETEAGFQSFLTENNLSPSGITVLSDFISASAHLCKKFSAIGSDATVPARIACGNGKNQSWKEVRKL